jgi:hypothetical protein
VAADFDSVLLVRLVGEQNPATLAVFCEECAADLEPADICDAVEFPK